MIIVENCSQIWSHLNIYFDSQIFGQFTFPSFKLVIADLQIVHNFVFNVNYWKIENSRINLRATFSVCRNKIVLS